MPQSEGTIHLRLTPAQVEQIKAATGRAPEALTLHPEELEDRIAPSMAFQPWQSLE